MYINNCRLGLGRGLSQRGAFMRTSAASSVPSKTSYGRRHLLSQPWEVKQEYYRIYQQASLDKWISTGFSGGNVSINKVETQLRKTPSVSFWSLCTCAGTHTANTNYLISPPKTTGLSMDFLFCFV